MIFSWGSGPLFLLRGLPDPLANQQAPHGGSTHGYGYSTTGQVPHQSTSNGRSSQPVYASLPGTGWTYVGEAYPATGGKQPTHQPQTYGATPHTNQQTQYSYANAQNAQNNHGYVQPGYSRPVTSQYGQPQSGYPQPGYSSQQVATKPSRSRPVIPIPELPQQPASDSSYSGPVIPDMAEVLRDKKEAKSKGVLKKIRKS
ncbi:hypothetical protein K474DRAFT_1680411 [Panus rudis PR-1116 ss-1]|nr:hypothetical protein K474DRAFT_1680411 [Panus rudis PR-1116 ss-1]